MPDKFRQSLTSYKRDGVFTPSQRFKHSGMSGIALEFKRLGRGKSA